MPTILHIDGFRLYFYSADWNEPIHVHIEHGEGEAKFCLRPVRLASSYWMKAKELKKARRIVEQNAELIAEKWHEYFGSAL